MFTCVSCGSKHTEGPACCICKQHFDFQCSGITESGFRKLGDRRNNWRCPKCKSSPTPSPAAMSPMPNQLDKIQEQLNNMMLQLAPLTSLLEDVKSIKIEVNGLKESLEMAYQLISNFSGTVQALGSRVTKVEKTCEEIPSLRAEITKLRQELEDKDQWARANNVEIRGIPLKKNENLYDIAQKIGQTCDFPIKKEAINYLARVPTRVPNAEKPILIAFHSRYTKEEFLASLRKKKPTLADLGFSGDGIVFCTDHLTQRNKILLSKARSLAKEKNFKHIWVKHCKILARKNDTSPAFFIKCEKDLSKIV